MKKNTVIIIVCSLLIFAVGGVTWANRILLNKKHIIEKADKPVADIINYGSQLIQIEDKLYYSVNSYNRPITYGIYEIETGQSHRIWWDGIVSPLNTNAGKNLLYKYKDSLADFNSETKTVYLYDKEKKDFDYSNGYEYEYVNLLNAIREVSGKTIQPMNLCVFGERIYYFCYDINLDLCLYEFDDMLKKETLIYKTTGEISVNHGYFYTYDDCVYLEYSNYESKVLCIEYNTVLNETRLISEADYLGVPITVDTGVICTYNEVFSVDRASGERILIAESDNMILTFLFDSNWVYYSPKNNSLWRVTLDGLINEEIF